MRPFSYIPDDKFDCGELGTHEVEFISWIDNLEPGRPRVNITHVQLKIIFEGYGAQIINITSQIRKYPAQLEKYEDQILQAWLKQKRDIDESPINAIW